MNNGKATIIAYGEKGLRVSAAAARISTTEGGAMSAFEKGDGGAKDIKLVGKVLASGHQTIVEHQNITIAFCDVSVLAEQLIIEHRLASYTVKSRRYVNFSGAGYIVPEGLDEETEVLYRRDMDARFQDYDRLLALGIPREDARFVLPYCFRSNFYMTLNARELAHMIASMRFGRMSRYAEMRRLGEMLKAQADEIFPGIADMEGSKAHFTAPKEPAGIAPASTTEGSVTLRAKTENAKALLDEALAFSGRFDGEENVYKALVHDVRPRELEMLNYTFSLNHVSLACVTHFTRHRVQSLMVPYPEDALAENAYIVPATVRENAEALRIYTNAFEANAQSAQTMLARGMKWNTLVYYALAGHTVKLMLNMNARELLHFLRLRTCTRAQWEIRALANDMLCELNEDFRELFRFYGPSCVVRGFCPEGRLSCGRIPKREE